MHDGKKIVMKLNFSAKAIVSFFVVAVSVSSVFSQTSFFPIPQTQQRDALVLYNQNDYAGAIAICEEELHIDPERVDSYVVLCWALIANGQYREAEQRAQDGLRVSPYDLRLIESAGEAYYYLGQNDAALIYFQRFVANAPDANARVSMAYYFMGELYIRQARYQHADIAFTTAVQKQPSRDSWWVRLGYAREHAGNYFESLAAYDEALRLNPSSNDAKVGRERVSNQLR